MCSWNKVVAEACNVVIVVFNIDVHCALSRVSSDKLWFFFCWHNNNLYLRYCYVFSMFDDQNMSKKITHYGPGQALRVPGGSGSQISRQSALEGGKVVSHMHRPPLPPGNIPGTHFC